LVCWSRGVGGGRGGGVGRGRGRGVGGGRGVVSDSKGHEGGDGDEAKHVVVVVVGGDLDLKLMLD
jgi:hypothetical protein